MSDSLQARLEVTEERIRLACRKAGYDRTKVTLLAVTKGQSSETISRAHHLNLNEFGENRVQELLSKNSSLAKEEIYPKWHFLGHLQKNKVKDIVGAVDILHTLDSTDLVSILHKRRKHLKDQGEILTSALPMQCFIQVNVTEENHKSGVRLNNFDQLLETARKSDELSIVGLMVMAPYNRDANKSRPLFSKIRRLAELNELPQLSMGMSQDFEIAIEEGATIIRLGTTLFGERRAVK